MTIKHIIITGGGPWGFYSFGILGQIEKCEFIKREELESIYSTSIGCLVALFISLKTVSYDEIKKYVINKPSEHLFTLSTEHIFSLYSKKGVYDGAVIIKHLVEPLFHSDGLSPDITMKEFYEQRQIKLNFMTCDINNNFEEYCINYETEPDMPVYKAIAASSSIPLLFYPIQHGNKCLIDGGIINNYPINYFKQMNPEYKEEELIGIKNTYKNLSPVVINQESTILSYAYIFIEKLMNTLDKTSNNIINKTIKYEIPIEIKSDKNGLTDTDTIYGCFFEKKYRENMILNGEEIAKGFLESLDDNGTKNKETNDDI